MANQETCQKLIRLIHSGMQNRLKDSPFFHCDEECTDMKNGKDSYFRINTQKGHSFAMVNVIIWEGLNAVSVYLCNPEGGKIYKCKSLSTEDTVDAMLEKLIKPRI